MWITTMGLLDRKNSVYDIVSIESDTEFVFLSDSIGSINIYNQKGEVMNTFIHLESTNFGKDYLPGNYFVKFSSEGILYEEVIIK